MKVVKPILAESVTSISELKKNPMAVVEQADGKPVAVLNRSQIAFYCVPAKTFEIMKANLELLETTEEK